MPSTETDALTVPESAGDLELHVPVAEEGTVGLGTRVGRYVIEGVLGRGGMGTVYLASDPQLGRSVALKLMHPELLEPDPSRGRRRLLIEARAMARLAHPNVLTVHDVGLLGDRVFIAMEVVEGPTLRTWLLQEPRSTRAIVSAFVQAGRGLAAAHRAGIVHRDFKPENILLGGDGRFRVTDFGLAKSIDEDDTETLPSTDHRALSQEQSLARLTKDGALLGTPLYMAPETLLSKKTNERSDQYGFCVALYEALYGEHPFASPSLPALLDRVLVGQVAPPPRDSAVPGRLRRVLLRGLSVSPRDRWPSMDEMLDELEPRSPSRKLWWSTMGIGLAGGLLAAVPTDDGDRCSRMAERIDRVWNDERRNVLTDRLDQRSSDGLFARLDAYAADWRSRTTETCERSDDALQVERSLHCLRTRADEFDAAIRVLTDPRTSGSVHRVVDELASIDSCLDDRHRFPEIERPRDPAAAAEVERIEQLRLRAVALERAGRAITAREHFAALVPLARSTGHMPLVSRVLGDYAKAQASTGETDEAHANLHEALELAVEAGDDRQAARLWTELVYLVGFGLARYEEGLQLARSARAASERTNDPLLTVDLEAALGAVHLRHGHRKQARQTFERGLELARALVDQGRDDAAGRVATLHNNLGALAREDEDVHGALDHLRLALELNEARLLPTHPALADNLQNIADCKTLQGRHEEAIVDYRRAIAIFEVSKGPRSSSSAVARSNLASALLAAGRLDEAGREAAAALEILRDVYGEQTALSAAPILTQAGIARQEGRFEHALRLYERAEILLQAGLGTQHPYLMEPLLGKIRVHLDQGRRQQAVTLVQTARQRLQAHPHPPSARKELDELTARVESLRTSAG